MEPEILYLRFCESILECSLHFHGVERLAVRCAEYIGAVQVRHLHGFLDGLKRGHCDRDDQVLAVFGFGPIQRDRAVEDVRLAPFQVQDISFP